MLDGLIPGALRAAFVLNNLALQERVLLLGSAMPHVAPAFTLVLKTQGLSRQVPNDFEQRSCADVPLCTAVFPDFPGKIISPIKRYNFIVGMLCTWPRGCDISDG